MERSMVPIIRYTKVEEKCDGTLYVLFKLPGRLKAHRGQMMKLTVESTLSLSIPDWMVEDRNREQEERERAIEELEAAVGR